jgi:hypothetical protein
MNVGILIQCIHEVSVLCSVGGGVKLSVSNIVEIEAEVRVRHHGVGQLAAGVVGEVLC